MASADVTLPGSQGQTFPSDTTQRTATLSVSGGLLTNVSEDTEEGANDAPTIWINEGAGTVETSLAAGGTPIPPGASFRLDAAGKSFTFKAGSAVQGYLLYTRG